LILLLHLVKLPVKLDLFSLSLPYSLFKLVAHLSKLILSDGQQVIKPALLTFQASHLMLKVFLLLHECRIELLGLAGQVLNVNAELVLESDVLPDVPLELLDHLLVLAGHQVLLLNGGGLALSPWVHHSGLKLMSGVAARGVLGFATDLFVLAELIIVLILIFFILGLAKALFHYYGVRG
jgi:hypothetical protein